MQTEYLRVTFINTVLGLGNGSVSEVSITGPWVLSLNSHHLLCNIQVWHAPLGTSVLGTRDRWISGAVWLAGSSSVSDQVMGGQLPHTHIHILTLFHEHKHIFPLHTGLASPEESCVAPWWSEGKEGLDFWLWTWGRAGECSGAGGRLERAKGKVPLGSTTVDQC